VYGGKRGDLAVVVGEGSEERVASRRRDIAGLTLDVYRSSGEVEPDDVEDRTRARLGVYISVLMIGWGWVLILIRIKFWSDAVGFPLCGSLLGIPDRSFVRAL
jgi:hypothetical protein